MEIGSLIDWLQSALLILYGVTLGLLLIFSLHRHVMVRLYYKNRRKRPALVGRFEELPRVTVQLPVYNELYVVERLIRAVADFDYPRDRLEIQLPAGNTWPYSTPIFCRPENSSKRRSTSLPMREWAWCRPGGSILTAIIHCSRRYRLSSSTDISSWNTAPAADPAFSSILTVRRAYGAESASTMRVGGRMTP